MALSPIPHPLAHQLMPVRNPTLRTLLQVAVGVAFLALLAQFQLQVSPVPITGQTFGVLLLGGAYGAGLGALTVGTYLAVGALGLGVFAGGSAGLAMLAGPTGGYLIGFLAAATLVGFLCERGWGRSVALSALAMLIGSLLLYGFGLLWLGRLMPSAEATLGAGLIPFIPGDLIKLGLAATLLPGASRWLSRREKRS